MKDRVCITGMGMVTALGASVPVNLDALLTSRSGFGYTSYLDTIHQQSIPVAEYKKSTEALAESFHLPEASRTTLLGMIALKEAIENSSLTDTAIRNASFINASTVGGMCETEKVYDRIIDPQQEGSFLNLIDGLDCSDCTKQLARAWSIQGYLATISTACSSSANALIMGANLLKQGLAKHVICGGTEALTRFTMNGFLSLKNVDKSPCRPFDDTRNGLNLGEGAAYLVIELESTARQRGANIEAYLSGWCNTNEAFHPTSPSPEGNGALLAMQEALLVAQLEPSAIDYVNVHGTATLNNDISEGRALERLFGSRVPPFSSTKPFTGHTLAAAGGIEAIFSILALQNGVLFPNLNFEVPMAELSIQPQVQLDQGLPLKHIISNSFGFGGNNASLVFSAYEG
jgi:3-oxoacyl-(acyl-carrier-protein) synthase